MWRSPGRRTMTGMGLFFAEALLRKFSTGLLLFSFLAFRRRPKPSGISPASQGRIPG